MNSRTLSLGVALAMLAATPAFAQTGGGVPQFQVDALWPKALPNNWLIGQVGGIRVDKRNNIWVIQRPGSLTDRERAAEQNPPPVRCCVAAPPVLVFDTSGNLIKHWGGPGQGYNWAKAEHGIFIDDNDFVWTAGSDRTDGQILKFTLDGKFVMQIGKPITGPDSNATNHVGSAADLAVDTAAKEVYVADGYTNRRVVVFDSETGAYKRHWGAYGKPPSDAKTAAYDPSKPPSPQFGNPVHCVRISNDGLVYVCDRTNDRIQVFRKDGTFLSEHFYEKNTKMTGSVYEIAFSSDPEQKFFYTVDGANGEIRIVERKTMDVVGRFGRIGRQAGQFIAVHNVTVDHEGNIYTAEVNTGQRIQKFRKLD